MRLKPVTSDYPTKGVLSSKQFFLKGEIFKKLNNFKRKSTHKGAELFARAAGALTSVVEDDALIIAHLPDVGR